MSFFFIQKFDSKKNANVDDSEAEISMNLYLIGHKLMVLVFLMANVSKIPLIWKMCNIYPN